MQTHPLATRSWWVFFLIRYFTKRTIQSVSWYCFVHCVYMYLILQEVVAFSVLDFSVEYHPSCDYDRLSYYDGPDATSIEPTVYCGYHVLHIPTSSGDVTILEFVSNWRYARRGFQIIYEAKSKYFNNNASNMFNQMAGGYFDIKKHFGRNAWISFIFIFVWKYLCSNYVIFGVLYEFAKNKW